MTDAEYRHQLWVYNITTDLINTFSKYISPSHPFMQYLYRKNTHPQLIQDMEDFFYNALCEDMNKHHDL